jgi:hypothetical protein
MPLNVPFVPILADAEAVIAAIVILVTIIGWVANLVSNKNQKGPPVANRPRPPARPRDDRLQEEISIFIEDAGGQRSRQGSRGGATARPGPAARNPQGKRPAAPPQPKKPPRRPRPGEEISTRHAPVTETLGTGVKQHVSQTMSERVSQEVQQRLAPRVEEKVAEDLGTPVTTGATRASLPADPAPPPIKPERFAELLRNRTGVQQAIVLNLILSPPAYRTRASRR